MLLLIIFDSANNGLLKAIGNVVCGNAPSVEVPVGPFIIPPWLNT